MWLLPWKKKDKDKSSNSPSSKRKGGSQSAPSSPRLTHQRKTFGVPLDAAPKAPGSKVPLVVDQVVRLLRETALDTEGLFRVPGSVAEINELIRAFDEGQQVNLKNYDVHALAGLLKKFFRDLPSPLVVTQLNNQIAVLFRNGTHNGPIEDILARMRTILYQLPAVHFESLKCLVSLLVDLFHHTSTNKMSLSNLVTCVVPSLDCSPAIITYSIQNFDFFFNKAEEAPPLTHSAPQPILRRSVSPSKPVGNPLLPRIESPLAASPRHTIALQPPTWLASPSSPRAIESHALKHDDAVAERAPTPISPILAPLNLTLPPISPRGSGGNIPTSPRSSNIPISPRGLSMSTSGASPSFPIRAISTSGNLLPPPPQASSSPSRRNFMNSNRFSVALTSSHSSPPSRNSPQSTTNSVSLQISTSYPHSPPTSFSPSSAPSQEGSPTHASRAFGPDWYVHQRVLSPARSLDKTGMTRQPSDYFENRPRASSYAPQPTFLFGSDTEDADEPTRRSSLQKSQDPLRYTTRKSKKDKESLVDEEKEKKERRKRDSLTKSKERERGKEADKLKDREKRKEREREREREKEREREREREREISPREREKRFSRRVTINTRQDKDVARKLEDLQADIQREREKTETATARTAEIEARLRYEESHSNALKQEIERLKKKLHRQSHVVAKSVVIDTSYDDDSEEEENDPLPVPASSNVPWGATGKMEVKIRMPMPFP